MNDIPLCVYLIAGEASGDFLGARLMRELKDITSGNIVFYGIGGDKMAAEGLKSLFPYYELSLMGFIEIVPHAIRLLARINLTVEEIIAKKPAVVVTIDSPGFCFRVVEKLRERASPSRFVHYVAPTVWAYKPERAKKCARLFDHMLALLPFEPPYFLREGLACTFVGHPVVAETRTSDGALFRQRHGIAAEAPLFCLLPGSRKNELKRHMPIFRQAITLLAGRWPNLSIAAAVPKPVMPMLMAYFQGCPFQAILIAEDEEKKDAMAASDIALVKSGTVALEVAMAGTPMVVAYRVNPLTAWMVRRMMIAKYVNLINILENEEIVPELLQECCTPPLLADALATLLGSDNRYKNQQDQFNLSLEKLLPAAITSPSRHAAEIVLQHAGK